MLGVDHQEVGKMIAEKWKLNDAMTSAIAFHHDVDGAAEEHRVRAAYVGLANMYANILDLGYAGDPFPADTDVDRMMELTGVSWDMFQEVATSVEEEIEKAQAFLQN